MDPRARDPRLQGRRASPSSGDPRKRSLSRGPGDDARKRQRDASSHRPRYDLSIFTLLKLTYMCGLNSRDIHFQAFNAWGGVHGSETGTVQNGPFSYAPEMVCSFMQGIDELAKSKYPCDHDIAKRKEQGAGDP